ncbi:hypothetical protein FRX31_006442 [Thalictrum thalictroides]|uniref:Uncharacterized protein n=1 Tax=Thalictrum thalictroides TaxID=46969 RepID=A0A7J6X6H4_THATH|nr:hypothetical protein FRX31_006442 [Thalictrum thalictroides]
MPFISISERVNDSVRRSMCELHFNAFTSFHNTIAEFGDKMNSESLLKHAYLLAFFPIPPSKVGKHNWIHFRSWLQYGIGEKVRDICLPWVTYGISTIRTCAACRQASVYVRNPHDDDVIVISSDSELTEENDEDELDSATEGEQSLTRTLGCNSECSCPSDCNEDCECMMYQYGRQRLHTHNVVHMQVTSAVERSLCSNHYKGFQSFHDNIYAFCSSVSMSDSSVKNIIFQFFPNAPLTVRLLDWANFGYNLMAANINNTKSPSSPQLRRSAMTEECRNALRARDRLLYRQRRNNFSAQQLHTFQERQRQQRNNRRQNISAEQRLHQLARRRLLYQNHRRQNLTEQPSSSQHLSDTTMVTHLQQHLQSEVERFQIEPLTASVNADMNSISIDLG